jgi:hypothetical protein
VSTTSSFVFVVLEWFSSRRIVWEILAIESALGTIVWCFYSERRRADKAEKLLEKERPKLRGCVEETFMQAIINLDSPAHEPIGVQVFIKIVIYNESLCPTTTRSYDLTIGNGQENYAGKRIRGVRNFLIADEHGNAKEGMSDLNLMTETDPIKKGVHREGWLLFNVRGIDIATAVRAKLKIEAIDAFGTRHELSCSLPPILVSPNQMVGQNKFLLTRLRG